MIESRIICDVTGKELVDDEKSRDLVEMSTCTIQYKNVGMVKMQGKKGLENKRMVLGIENYSFHICQEHSKDFMEHIKKFFVEKKNANRN